MSQPIRWSIQMFASDGTVGGLLANHHAADGRECSAIVPVMGLVHKTVDIFATTADLAAHPVVIQGSTFASGDGNPEWYDLTLNINTNGLTPILIPDQTLTGVLLFEPELTYIRIIAAPNDFGGGTLPRSMKAMMAGLWWSHDPWAQRCKDKFGI